MNTKEITLEMLGFGCPSCVYTIEKTGRKIPAVQSISVSLADQRIRITHIGERGEIIEKISEIVNRIGHDVREIPDAPAA